MSKNNDNKNSFVTPSMANNTNSQDNAVRVDELSHEMCAATFCAQHGIAYNGQVIDGQHRKVIMSSRGNFFNNRRSSNV